MRNLNKLFSPNGQLRIEDTQVHTGDWHTITVSSDAVFTQLKNGSVNILTRDNLTGKNHQVNRSALNRQIHNHPTSIRCHLCKSKLK